LPWVRPKLLLILAQIARHTQLVKTEPVSKVIYTYLEESGYLTLLTLEENQYNHEQLNFLQQFVKKVRTWEEETLSRSLAEFLEMMALELEAGETGALSIDTEAGPDAIKIMTVHASKA
jgi:ATP-dependent exoDNAse (exonuclease V) beta subunit